MRFIVAKMLLSNGSSNESLVASNQSEWELAASPDLSISFYIISAVWLAVCGILGVSLNGMVLWAFYKDSKVMQKLSHYIVTFLTFSAFGLWRLLSLQSNIYEVDFSKS